MTVQREVICSSDWLTKRFHLWQRQRNEAENVDATRQTLRQISAWQNTKAAPKSAKQLLLLLLLLPENVTNCKCGQKFVSSEKGSTCFDPKHEAMFLIQNTKAKGDTAQQNFSFSLPHQIFFLNGVSTLKTDRNIRQRHCGWQAFFGLLFQNKIVDSKCKKGQSFTPNRLLQENPRRGCRNRRGLLLLTCLVFTSRSRNEIANCFGGGWPHRHFT